MKQLHHWKFILDHLQQNIPVMLLYVLESSGSSPGRQGFFMAVAANGKMEGSIGGGIMEHKFVEMARGLWAVGSGQSAVNPSTGSGRQSAVKKQVHNKSAERNQSGMICSGEQTIWIYPVRDSDATAIQHIISSLNENKNGTLTLSRDGIRFSDDLPSKDFEFEQRSEADWTYKEKTGYKNQLFIIGGGHCALAFSRLMRSMDFYIHVYDERKDLKTIVENEAAHEKHLIGGYSELKNLIHPGDNHYVVIMTFGYRSDDIAVRALMEKKFRYFGLLGSKKKIEKMFQDYKKEGISDDTLQRIHAPIGLAIKSQTPEEIAISIAAEMISVKNG